MKKEKKPNPKVHAIFLRGAPGSGKDTFADSIIHCISSITSNIKKFPFADAVRKEVAEKYGLNYDLLCNDYNYKCLHRDKQIKVANDRRAENNEYWVHKVIAEILKWSAGFKEDDVNIAVITDCRYNNEMAVGERLVGTVFKSFHPVYIHVHDEAMMKRKGGSLEDYVKWQLLKWNISERDVRIDNYPYSLIVENGGLIDELQHDAMKLISRILRLN